MQEKNLGGAAFSSSNYPPPVADPYRVGRNWVTASAKRVEGNGSDFFGGWRREPSRLPIDPAVRWDLLGGGDIE
jgi:hypothetical protein